MAAAVETVAGRSAELTAPSHSSRALISRHLPDSLSLFLCKTPALAHKHSSGGSGLVLIVPTTHYSVIVSMSDQRKHDAKRKRNVKTTKLAHSDENDGRNASVLRRDASVWAKTTETTSDVQSSATTNRLSVCTRGGKVETAFSTRHKQPAIRRADHATTACSVGHGTIPLDCCSIPEADDKPSKMEATRARAGNTGRARCQKRGRAR